MQSRDISLEVIEAVAGDPSGGIQIDTVKALHDLCVIRNLKIRHDRIAELLQLDIFGIILADRNLVRDHLRDDHHVLVDDFLRLFLDAVQFLQSLRVCRHLLLQSLGLFPFSFLHQRADLFADRVFLRTDAVSLCLCLSGLCILGDHFVYQRQFLILKLLPDVLFDRLRIFSDELNIEHNFSPPQCNASERCFCTDLRFLSVIPANNFPETVSAFRCTPFRQVSCHPPCSVKCRFLLCHSDENCPVPF